MTEAKPDNRPLSPHLSIYRLQITSALSILHRIAGVALTLGAALVVWWFLAASTNADYFTTVDGLLTSWLGGLVMIGSAWALWFHFCNGIRHLVWDIGYGFEISNVRNSGLAAIAGSVILTGFTILAYC